MIDVAASSPRRRFIPVSALPTHFPEMQLSESRIRWWLYKSENNGFDACTRRVGRRIFVDIDLFLQWIDGKLSPK